tara:strand:+ start:3866 stop:3994 length:129 start_codon:yes stop_codon:yes gene_type:complete
MVRTVIIGRKATKRYVRRFLIILSVKITHPIIRPVKNRQTAI